MSLRQAAFRNALNLTAQTFSSNNYISTILGNEATINLLKLEYTGIKRQGHCVVEVYVTGVVRGLMGTLLGFVWNEMNPGLHSRKQLTPDM